MPQDVQPRKIDIEAPAIKLEPHELEQAKKEALLKKVRASHSRQLFDRAKVEGRADKVYKWVNIDEDRVTWFEGLGYVICKDPTVKVQANWRRQDGTIKRGDLILMEIDKDLEEAIDVDSQLRAVEAMQSKQEGFKAFAERERIPYKIDS